MTTRITAMVVACDGSFGCCVENNFASARTWKETLECGKKAERKKRIRKFTV